eukprot:tig00021036_g17343.t1
MGDDADGRRREQFLMPSLASEAAAGGGLLAVGRKSVRLAAAAPRLPRVPSRPDSDRRPASRSAAGALELERAPSLDASPHPDGGLGPASLPASRNVSLRVRGPGPRPHSPGGGPLTLAALSASPSRSTSLRRGFAALAAGLGIASATPGRDGFDASSAAYRGAGSDI